MAPSGPNLLDIEEGMSWKDAMNIAKKVPNYGAAPSKDVKKDKVNPFIKKLKKLDGQDSSGKGGGRLAGAAGVIDKFQGMREQAKWKGDDNPDPVRGGVSKNPYQVTSEGYSGGMKSSEGPQTTLLRDPETGKKKKKNKNYEDY